MCLTLFAVLALAQSNSITVDDITMGGSTLNKQGNPEYGCQVMDMSADGKVVVGQGTPVPESRYHGFAWDDVNRTRVLPAPTELQNNYPGIMATCISDDGKVIGGKGLWLEPGAKIAKYFKAKSMPASSLGNWKPVETTITAINEDGSALGIEVFKSSGVELFVWRAGKGLKPLLDAKGNKLQGAITDISGDGKVVAGISSLGQNNLGFLISNGSYLACPPLKGYSGSRVLAVSYDGKLAFGNYAPAQGYQEAGFVWKPGKGKPELLPHNFVVESVSNEGYAIAGWAGGDPALMLGRTVIKMKDILKDRMMDEEIRGLKLVDIEMTTSYFYILADSAGETTDYRIKIFRRR